MKKSLLARGLACGVALASSAAFLVTLAPTAHAATPVIVAVGSDTTQDVMGAILNGTGQYNVLAQQPTALTVPADAPSCTVAQTYHTPAGAGEVLAPNGSGAGRNALIAEETAAAGSPRGCIDIARSSGAPRGIGAGKDTATMQYYAFAMDSVSVVSPSLAAPGTISQADLLKVYNCTFTDWSQLPGGGTGPIQRYIPQAGSGTRTFFISDMLGGFDPTTISSASCPAVNQSFEENQATQVLPADHEKAILPYSTGQWIFQANNRLNPSIDVRNGAKVIGQTTTGVGTNANTARWNTTDAQYENNTGTTAATPVNEANIKLNNATPDFNGIRYVFNVVDTVSPDYSTARGLVGFDNVAAGAKSPICANSKRTTILSYGFAPLSTTAGGATNLAGSSCRYYPPA